jgi:hypothetical protein
MASHLLGLPEVLRETAAAQKDMGVGVFDPHTWDALYDAGAAFAHQCGSGEFCARDACNPAAGVGR